MITVKYYTYDPLVFNIEQNLPIFMKLHLCIEINDGKTPIELDRIVRNFIFLPKINLNPVDNL